MSDDEAADIEEVVRQKQDTAIEVLHGIEGSLATFASELAKRPTDEELRAQLKDQRSALEYNRKRGLRGLTIGGVIIILMLFLIGVPLLINSFANRATATAIKECTTPGPIDPTVKDPFNTGHKCFDDGQTRTAGILSAAASNEVIVLSCYRYPETGELRPLAEFADCVKKNLPLRSSP